MVTWHADVARRRRMLMSLLMVTWHADVAGDDMWYADGMFIRPCVHTHVAVLSHHPAHAGGKTFTAADLLDKPADVERRENGPWGRKWSWCAALPEIWLCICGSGCSTSAMNTDRHLVGMPECGKGGRR